MNRACIAATLLVSALVTAPVAAQQRPEADLCAVPPGAQPLLPAKRMPKYVENLEKALHRGTPGAEEIRAALAREPAHTQLS